jgi:hypothetical protein
MISAITNANPAKTHDCVSDWVALIVKKATAVTPKSGNVERVATHTPVLSLGSLDDFRESTGLG